MDRHKEKAARRLLSEKRISELIALLVSLPDADAADLISSLPESDKALTFRLLGKDAAAAVFACLDADTQESIIRGMGDAELSGLIEELFTDDAVDMLEEMPAGIVSRVLRLATKETRNTLNLIMQYPEDSAAGIMTSEFIVLKEKMKVSEAIDYIRATGADKETVYVAYATDVKRRLIGIVDLRDLLFAPGDKTVGEIMDPDVVSVTTLTDREATAAVISKYDLLAVPVVDGESRLVGIVTVDDAIDVIRDEASEDISIMAGVTPGEKPYLKTGVMRTFASRIPWLLLMMVSATFTGLIITHFESALASLVALTAFIPMLMDTGGNSGSQASVTVIRALSLGDISPKDILKVIFKEFRVSLLCGLSLSAACFLKVMLVDMLILGTEGVTLAVAAVVSLTLGTTVVCAKLSGAALPLLAKKIGLDPALVASPAITTIVDIVSLIIYFTIAGIILGI